MPEDWTEVQLCRDVYHCTPSDLDAQDQDRVLRHLALLSAEARVRNFEQGGKQGSRGGKGMSQRRKRKESKEAGDGQ